MADAVSGATASCCNSLSTGFRFLFAGASNDPDYKWLFQLFPNAYSAGTTCANTYSRVCTRQIYGQDGNDQILTVTCDGTTLSLYVDGVPKDSNNCNQWQPANNFWQIGQANLNATFLDGWVWNRALSSAEVWILAYLFQHGLSPSSDSLMNGAVQHWTFNNCDSSHCPNSISGAPAAIFDTTPPTVAITTPSNASSLSGSVRVTATCTDRVAATSVQFVIDNAVVATLTAGPFTTTWDTTKVVDGSHTIYAVCTNISGLISTSPTSTVSTSNGVSGKTVYLDPTSGTDCPTNAGLSLSSPCSTFGGVNSVINSNPLHGGDSILLKAGTNININDLNTSSILQLCGPSASSTFCGRTLNVYPGKTITIGTYGGSGNCNILSGITTDCASITLASNTGNVPRDGAALIAINVPNLIVQNLRIFGSQSNALVCPPNQSTGCSEGIKYGTANGYFNGSPTSTTTFQNIEITDFFIQLYISNATSPGYLTRGYLCGVTVQNNYMHGSTVSTAVSSGIQVSGANCNLGASGPTAATVTGNYTKNQGGIGGQAVGSGIIMSNQSVGVVDNYNATTAVDGNLAQCVNSGGGYGNWWYQSMGIAAKGNESYNSWPPTGTRCGADTGAFDFDNGTSQGLLEFNYAHTTYGLSLGFFQSAVGAFPMGPNTAAYNIFENGVAGCGDNTCAMFNPGGGAGSWSYNNIVWNGYNSTPRTIYGGNYAGYINGSAVAWGAVCSTGGLFANNMVVANGHPGVGVPANLVTRSWGGACAKGVLQFANNDWYPLAGSGNWEGQTSVTGWNNISGDTGISVNPNFASAGPLGSPPGTILTCYAGSGVPTAPTCATNYQLQSGSSLIGAGLNLALAPYSLTVPTTDYFRTTIPNGVGTGFNLGADGAHR